MSASRQVYLCLGLLGMFVFSGCATIVSGRHDEVAIRSNPPQAHVVVHNDEGEMVTSGITPMKVTLPRSKGLLRKPPRYTATMQKSGYKPTRVAIKPKINPWVAGNLFVGPIGLVTDAATGAVWQMSPSVIDKQLDPLSGPMHARVQQNQITQATFVSDQ